MDFRVDLFQNPKIGSSRLAALSDRFPIKALSFQTSRFGGFDEGSFGFEDVPRDVLFAALNDWRFNRIQVSTASGEIAYEGMIAKIAATDGEERYTRSIDDIVNRLYVLRRVPRVNSGSRIAITTRNDTTSQDFFGIIKAERLDLSGLGFLTEANANRRGDLFLARRKVARADSYALKGELSSNSKRTLQITTRGFFDSLDYLETRVVYLNAVRTSKIAKDLIGSTANQLLASDTTAIEDTNTYITYNERRNLKTPLDILSTVATYGTDGFELAIQVFEDRILRVSPRATSGRYVIRPDSARIWTEGFAASERWKVRAGDYARRIDFDSTIAPFSDINDDPRAILIERTKYDALRDSLELVPFGKFTVEELIGRMARKSRPLKG